MDQYRAGDIDIVTSVDTGRQGLDAEFDFVLLLGNIESQLRGLQMVGRGTRRSNRFPVTVYGQFINIALPQNRKKLSKLFLAEQAFSNESVIRQGRVLNTTMQGKNKEPNAGVDISKFSELIRDMLALIDRKAMSEVLIGRNYELGSVEGKIPLNQILEQCNVSEVLAKKRLRAAGHAWSGRYERLGDKIQLVPYYSPEAEAYLKRIFPKQQPNALHLSAIAEAAGVHHQVAERNLTEEDRAAATVKPHANKLGYVHETTVWPADVAADIIDRLKVLKPRKLPAHLVPISDQFRKLLHNYRRTPREEIQRLLALGNFDTQDITITGSLRHTQAVSWSGFAHLQQVFGLPKGKDRIVIDPERLPTGPDDLDPEKVAYAQEIQRQFIAAERLERYDLGRKGEKSKPDHGSGNAADERT